jgi:alcohol dehydrogenase, propanol-preferring
MVARAWNEPFQLEQRPEPEPGPGEAVMKVRAAGVGLTLMVMRTGVFGGVPPRVMGHELAGDVVAVGDGVSHVRVGDRCAVYFYLTCGHCRRCLGGRETLCENHGGYVGVHVDGGFADYVRLPAGNFLPLPDGLGYEAAAIAADAVNTNWHCMRERAQIAPQDDVLLVGAGGGVGVHGVQVAKAFGARVIAADVSDEKLAFARDWGADEVINVRAVRDLAAEVHRLTDGKGADAAIDYVGRDETLQACIDSLGSGGRAVAIGTRPEGNAAIVRSVDFVQKEKSVSGSRHSSRGELLETMDLMARGTVKPAIGRRVHFTEVESLFDDLAAERLLGRGALTYD